jgi:hypothetical protein
MSEKETLETVRVKIIYRIVVVLTLLLILIQQILYYSNRVFELYPRKDFYASCQSANWFSEDNIFGDVYAGETWGRWTKSGKFSLRFKAHNAIKKLQFPVQRLSASTVLQFESSNVVIGSVEIRPDNVEISLPPHNLPKVYVFNFIVSKPNRPIDVNPRVLDYRKLGVGVSKFYIQCQNVGTSAMAGLSNTQGDFQSDPKCDTKLDLATSLAYGWQSLESWGIWSAVSEPKLLLSLPKRFKYLELDMRLPEASLDLRILADGKEIKKDADGNSLNLKSTIKRSDLKPGLKLHEVKFITNRVIPVQHLEPQSSDFRQIGVGVVRIYIGC